LKREADHERLVRLFSAAGEAIELADHGGQNPDGDLGSHYR